MLEKPSSSAETPWNLPWATVIRDLQPPSSEVNKLASLTGQIRDVLQANSFSSTLHVGGSLGKQSHIPNEKSLILFQHIPSFDASDYFNAHLSPLYEAIKNCHSYKDVRMEGLSIRFVVEDVQVCLYATGELFMGPKELLLPMNKPRQPDGNRANNDTAHAASDAKQVHLATSCELLRVKFIAAQSSLFHNMVRVAKKWRTSSNIMSLEDTPDDYLLELLMLHCVHSTPVMDCNARLYDTIFRRFLQLICASTTNMGSVNVPGLYADPPNTFLWWDMYYKRSCIDEALSRGLFPSAREGCALVIVDPAAPIMNVANGVNDWAEVRGAARDTLASMVDTDAVEALTTRLHALTEGMQRSIESLSTQLSSLQRVERAPRRWAGTIRFTERHMGSDAWVSVCEMEMRCVMWRVNARKSRSEGVGYSAVIDLSLMCLAERERVLDVDVEFRGNVVNLSFDEKNDHVLIAKRSEVVRNRDYAMQITIIG